MKKARPFLISGSITVLIMVTISFFIEDTSQARGTLVSGLIAAITMMAIPIYDINRWSLMKRSIAHFLLILITVLPLLIYSGWFNPVVAIGVFLLFGLVGWTVGYTIHRVQHRSSNKINL